MPSHYVAKCSFQYDSTLPRDAIMINPCFRSTLQTNLGDSFCQALADSLATWTNFGGPLTVKTYDLEGTKPVFPAGQYTKNPAVTPPVYDRPRELAVCLSFYGTQNIRRKRGRIYIPAMWVGGTMGLRPTTAQQNTAHNIKSVFSGAGGADVQWIVWSRAANAATEVTNYWVDDEWDIQRRRGLRATGRVQGATVS